MIGYKPGMVIINEVKQRVLIELEISDEIFDNINKSYIIKKENALYKCNKCKVNKIVDLYGNEYNEAITNIYNNGDYHKYKTGEEIIEPNYNLNEVSFGYGIYFYLKKEIALNYRLSYKFKYNRIKNKLCLNCENPIEFGQFIEYYDNGNVKNIYTFENYKLNGVVEEYFKNGCIYSRINYKDNFLDGIAEFFNQDGTFYKSVIYNDGIIKNKLLCC